METPDVRFTHVADGRPWASSIAAPVLADFLWVEIGGARSIGAFIEWLEPQVETGDEGQWCGDGLCVRVQAGRVAVFDDPDVCSPPRSMEMDLAPFLELLHRWREFVIATPPWEAS